MNVEFDDARGAGAVGRRRDCRHIDEADERVGDDLGHDGADVRTHHGGHHRAVIAAPMSREVDRRDPHPEIAKRPGEQGIRASVAGAHDHDPWARWSHDQCRGEQQGRLATRGHAGHRSRSSRNRLELDHRLLEELRVAAAVATVCVAAFHCLIHRGQVGVRTDRCQAQWSDQVDAVAGITATEPGSGSRCGGIDASGHGAGCAAVRKNGAAPA